SDRRVEAFELVHAGAKEGGAHGQSHAELDQRQGETAGGGGTPVEPGNQAVVVSQRVECGAGHGCLSRMVRPPAWRIGASPDLGRMVPVPVPNGSRRGGRWAWRASPWRGGGGRPGGSRRG